LPNPPATPTQRFLDYLSRPADGHPVVNCGGNTRYLCAKGTGVALPPLPP
jgi:hypothetical protein